MNDVQKAVKELREENQLLRRDLDVLRKSEQGCRNECKKLKEQTDFFKAAIEAAYEGIAIIRGGRHLYFNRSYLELTGYTDPDELSSIPATALLHPDDTEIVDIMTHRLSQSKPALQPQAGRIVKKDGGIVPVEFAFAATVYQGRQAMLCYLRDLSAQRRAEEAYEGSEKKYRIIVDNITDLLAEVDRRGRYFYVSPSYKKILGYSAADLLKKPVVDLVHPDDIDKLNGLVRRTIARKGESLKTEYRLRHKAGGYRWIEALFTFFYDGNGRYSYLHVDSRNITDRKDTEAALSASEALYQSIFENTGTVMLIIEEDMTISFANAEFENLTGYSRDEICGKRKWTEFVEKSELDRMVRQHRLRRDNPRNASRSYEFRLTRKGGSVRNILLTVDIIPGTRRSVASLLDLTDRKKAEEEAKRYSEEISDLYNNAPCGYHSLGPDGTFLQINDTELRWLGYERDEIVGRKKWGDILTPKSQALFRKTFTQLKKEGFTNNLEFEIVRKDGSILPVLLNATVIRDENGRFLMTRTTVFDITERRRLESQWSHIEKMEAVGTLSGGIAHDFNNILMSIQGLASLMRFDLKPKHPHYENLKKIEDQVRTGANLTRQLLGFARGGKYEVRPTDINALVEKVAMMFGRTRKGISISRRYRHDIWIVEADQGQIEQVLLNLFINAGQAMADEGELYLETDNVLLSDAETMPHGVKEGKYIMFSLTDTGTGMDEETLVHIFEPFFTTKEPGQGTGLGLASAYGIIRNHDGFIAVKSEPGKGSTFSIYLPATVREMDEEERWPERILKGRETILLVDDEEINIAIMKDILEKLGYHIFTAGGGQEATAIFMEKAREIDLVIMDMIMPGMGGAKTFDCLKEIDPDVKVIICSGYSMDGEAQKLLDRGCVSFIQKPFQLPELSRKIREAL
ncbi:MAG: Blue-light-activated protein [Syntrophaceae bacterium PtaU1.Bin231]|nr:MAG: Blue-light-activated protein [Syntrophaceae bacterium PtaU1.Bin231]